MTSPQNIKEIHMAYSEAAKRAQAKWDKANTIRVQMKLNTTTDADIIRKLEEVDSKQGYIKDLIRKDIIEKKDEEEEKW